MLCFALGKESEVCPSDYSSSFEFCSRRSFASISSSSCNSEVGVSSCPCAASVWYQCGGECCGGLLLDILWCLQGEDALFQGFSQWSVWYLGMLPW